MSDILVIYIDEGKWPILNVRLDMASGNLVVGPTPSDVEEKIQVVYIKAESLGGVATLLLTLSERLFPGSAFTGMDNLRRVLEDEQRESKHGGAG